MAVSYTLLSLSALLLMGGARAELDCGARGPKATVTGFSTSRKVPDVSIDYFFEYGNDATFFCSYDHTDNLVIRRESYSRSVTYLPTQVVNATTISSVLKPTLGYYGYFCMDRKSGCEHILVILHQPAMSVSSPRVHFQTKVVFDFGYSYFVPHGDDFQVICAGMDYKTLHIYNKTDESEVNTDILNDTAVMYRARADHIGSFFYGCSAENGAAQIITVTVDKFPKVHNFSCIAYDYGNKIDCSWIPSSAETTFKLFYKDKLLCFVIAGKNSSGCEWKNMFRGRRLFDEKNKNVSLVMDVCTDFICNNQTFTFDYYSITKIYPAFNLNVEDTSTHDAVVLWQHGCYSYNPCHYKVEYRLLAFVETWRQTDTSSVRCGTYYGTCRFRLALPYPDSKYEVRVYRRPAAATDDRVWSDPASISLVSKPRAECGCKTGDHEPSEPITPSEASCEACELAEHITKNSKALSKFKSNLKQKRDRLLNKMKILDDINSLSSKFNSL